MYHLSQVPLDLRRLFFKLAPTPDDIDQKKQAAKEEIDKVLKYSQSISKDGGKFLFGDKVCYILYNLL